MNDKTHILGIDLGTTNSSIAIWRNNTCEIIPDEYGNKTIPSYVSYTNITKYVGTMAQEQRHINVDNVFFDVKRLIGRTYNDPAVQSSLKFLTYTVIENERGMVSLQSTIKNNKIFSPEEISASVLMKLKDNAQKYLKCDIKDVIITIPANFTDSQRQATKDAATIAGLNCIRTIHEPTAAALAYGMMERSKNTEHMKVLVYDFGGGTLDVNLIDICDGIFEVQCTAGITHLGGVDFDNRLINFCMASFSHKHNVKIEHITRVSMQKLRTACEMAKKILSTNMNAVMMVDDFYDGKNLFVKISRKDFENLCRDLFLLAMYPINDILNECEITEDDINEVILVGGMTHMPYIREMLNIKFKKKVNCSINPDEAIAVGASIQGYILANKDDPFSNSITLMDITPLTLGIEVMGGIMDVLIKRNTMIPCEKTKLYSTDTDYIDSVTIKIFEGERALTAKNIKIGEFELDKIPTLQKGEPEIEITFNIDINGILSVTALEKNVNEPKNIIVNTNKNGLKPSQLQALIDEAQEEETVDALNKIKKTFHYELKGLCTNIMSNINNKENKLTEKDIKIITDDINAVNEWLLKNNDVTEYENTITKLKNKYGILILQSRPDNNVLGVVDEINATNIYDNDDDENVFKQQFEKINNITHGMTEVEIAEITKLKTTLIDLCKNINNMVDSVNISSDHKREILHYVDDIMVWFYSHTTPNKIDYIDKIDNINMICDKIFAQYNNVLTTNSANTEPYSQQLETLCLTLITMINNNQLKGPRIVLFKNKLNNILQYIYQTPESSEYQEQCAKYIVAVNNTCDKIYESNSTYSDEPIISVTNEQHNGMSIIDLMRIKQNEEMNNIINEDN